MPRIIDIIDHTNVRNDELAYRGIKVPGIVRQFLVMEFQLAGIGVERDD